jgi:cell division protein ZapA
VEYISLRKERYKMANEVKVMICGKEYKLKTSESPNYVFALARALETKINEIVNSGSGSSPYGASIMVALSLLDDLNKANQKLDSIRTQTKEYVDEAGRTRIERDAAQKEIDVLKSKIVQLENMVKLKQLSESI